MLNLGLKLCLWHQSLTGALRGAKRRYSTVYHQESNRYSFALIAHFALTTSHLSRAGAPAMPEVTDFRSSARYLTFIAFLS